MLEIFRSRENESSLWRQQYEQKVQKTPVLITDIYDLNCTATYSPRYTIIKDIPLIEDIMRRIHSQEISFDRLNTAIESLMNDPALAEIRIHMLDMISIIRGIYESIPDRPTGPLLSPPGAYGETYFITQIMLWHKGHKWLVHATRTLDQLWISWKNQADLHSQTRENQIQREYIDTSLLAMSQYHAIGTANINVTLNITNEKTKITYIPRSIVSLINPILANSTAYGINISLPQIELFLEREYGYMKNEFVQPL